VTTERDKRREAVYEEDEVLGRPFDRTLAGRLVRTARPYAALIALMILILLVLTAADVAIPFLTRTAVDEHIVPELRGRPADGAGEARAEHLEGLLRLGLALAALLVLRFVLDFANVYGVQYAGQAVMHDLRMAIFSHFQKMSLRYFDRNPVGKLVTRGTSDIQVLNETFSGVLINLFKDVFLLLGLLGALLWLDWRLSLVTFVVLPALVAATVQFRRYARDAYRVVRAKVARINAFIAENIAGMAVVQVFNREDENLRRFREINDEHFRARMREVYVFAVFRPLVEIISSAAIALVVWYGGGRALAGGMSLGSLVAFIALVQMFFRPIQDLSEKYNLLQAAMASSERIFQVLDEPEEVPDPPSPAEPAESRGRVEFRDVWFAYQGEDWVLKGVSFVLEPGKSLALVGPTGAGKSTIAHLLGRYSDVTRGEVRVDGMDVRRLPKARLRRRIGTVMQDVFLFSGDIRSNIRLRNPDITDESVVRAAETVLASTFIDRLPNRYVEVVKERGSTLSAGERQLLAFARALAFDPPILVLDEATASVDTDTEAKIQGALEKLRKGRTCILIAHRLSTVRNVDRILVLRDGKIVEEGNHDELLRAGGFYRALYETQAGAAN
jgi:ATP-binding cassette subfamily B multidrug efflux pump